MKVSYKLEQFEGPLDLLLHLIDKNELDIYDIPIKEITDQYLTYIKQMHQFELDVASEFLVMAATLLAIKSKLLLPKPPVEALKSEEQLLEQDPRVELVQKLIEYRKYKLIAEMLREKEMERSLVYTREPGDLTPYFIKVPENPVKDIAPEDLFFIFKRLLKKMASRQVVSKIRRDEISVQDRMKQLLEILERQEGRFLFSKLMSEDATRLEIVVTFMALLELMKIKKVSVFQHQLFEDIVVSAK
jgi:segregation and condensation protein A